MLTIACLAANAVWDADELVRVSPTTVPKLVSARAVGALSPHSPSWHTMCMHTWIQPAATAMPPPSAVVGLVEQISSSAPALRRTESTAGGLLRTGLVTALQSSLALPAPLTAYRGPSFSSNELDLESRTLRLVVSVQAGRALTNNGALTASLAAAACETVDWLVMLVPTQYKKSTVYQKVRQQISGLCASRGINLDLAGIHLIAY